MKATVNGKVMELAVMKTYHNGMEAVYECVNSDGVWVAVTESFVIKEKINVRTRIDYSGDREGKCRAAVVTITGKTENEVESALEALYLAASKEGYEAARCDNVEEGRKGKGFTITEFFFVDSADDAKYFKKNVYKSFK
ncbi:hypothetical protein NYE69_12790 [Paenibacillus sp. FSL R5-0527]|uniref:hypothetical protein n=1 Tax=Paenibacillus sp. FSL R5-0527 TaxID=2975321 RepID=UPI00097B5327|nr:hypothetical protein BK140_17035 [Paenibacillus macerans]